MYHISQPKKRKFAFVKAMANPPKPCEGGKAGQA